MKIFIGTLLLVLGLVGILMEAAGNLPPELDIPFLDTAFAVIGIIVIGMGWMDELESGKASLIEIVKRFFQSDPFRLLGLNILLAVASQVIDSGMFPSAYVLVAQIFLAIASVFGFMVGYVKYKLKLFMLRQKI